MKLPWYLLNPEWRIVMVWTQLFSVVVIYNMLTVPLKFCFKEASLEYEKKTKILDYFLEIIWLL